MWISWIAEHETQMSATIDMDKINVLVEQTRLLDAQHALMVNSSHEVNPEMVSSLVDYIGVLTEHRVKLQELSVQEFAVLKFVLRADINVC